MRQKGRGELLGAGEAPESGSEDRLHQIPRTQKSMSADMLFRIPGI